MNLMILGAGHVGLVSAACFAEAGHDVVCLENDDLKYKQLKALEAPFFEPGLSEMLMDNHVKGRLQFEQTMKSDDGKAEICLITVGTPCNESGDADLGQVLKAAQEIGGHMIRPVLIVNKSTSPVGTADKIKQVIENELQKRNLVIEFDVAVVPEFLREGSAIFDHSRPDRIVIGTDNERARKKLEELYKSQGRVHNRLVFMDTKSAELTKYASNAMLATRISLMNEIANLCEEVGADIDKVREGVGTDKRIGQAFLNAGCGFGGSCFPKDIDAIIAAGEANGVSMEILKAVRRTNERQMQVIPKKIYKRFGTDLSNRVFAIWGLSFKSGTSDMRNASSLAIINSLTTRNAKIVAYDPKAMSEAKANYFAQNSAVSFGDDPVSILKDADALLLITEWEEFKNPDFIQVKQLLKNPVIYDGRNIYSQEEMRSLGFEYYPIGKKCEGRNGF